MLVRISELIAAIAVVACSLAFAGFAHGYHFHAPAKAMTRFEMYHSIVTYVNGFLCGVAIFGGWFLAVDLLG